MVATIPARTHLSSGKNIPIANDAFEIGQRYQGFVTRDVFEVVDIREMRKVGATKRKTYVYFQHEKTGKVCECELETAKRLLLKRINPATVF